MKRHARLAGDPARLLWVGDESDWRLMRQQPRPHLVCPEPGCGAALHSVVNSRGTRFLRHRAERGSRGGCGHWWVAGGTGPESAEHLWLKARLTAICLHLGWAAVPEDPKTFADVWVPEAGLALEVQLRRTDALARTRERFRAGARGVIWFVAAGVPANRTLFGVPAVRFGVVSAAEPTRAAAPWERDEPARLVVWGTVWRWDDWRLVTGRMSGYRFLAEVLSGRMGWCPPGTPGLPRGGWARWDELALVADAAPTDTAAWVEAEWRRRRERSVDRSGLLQPANDPESPEEREDNREQQWIEDRPPHYDR